MPPYPEAATTSSPATPPARARNRDTSTPSSDDLPTLLIRPSTNMTAGPTTLPVTPR
jgi:hypothetical protein